MKAVVYGPPCSGKTTIAAAIADLCPGVARMSCRSMCLAEAAKGTVEGILWQSCEQDRRALPEGLANGIAVKYLRGLDSFVVDGYPKTSAEAEFFNELTGGPTHLIIAHATLEESVHRASERVECARCMRSTTKSQRQCPVCGGPLVKRSEDVPDVVTSRYQEYLSKAEGAIPILRRAAGQTYEGSCDELIRSLRGGAGCFRGSGSCSVRNGSSGNEA